MCSKSWGTLVKGQASKACVQSLVFSSSVWPPLSAFPQILRVLTQGQVGGWIQRGREASCPLSLPFVPLGYIHAACFSLSWGVLFPCNREGAFPQRCVSPALLFPELSVSFYSPVRELKDELKSNTFVWEWDVCQTAGIELLELALSANVSPARIAGRILKVTWTRPDF